MSGKRSSADVSTFPFNTRLNPIVYTLQPTANKTKTGMASFFETVSNTLIISVNKDYLDSDMDLHVLDWSC